MIAPPSLDIVGESCMIDRAYLEPLRDTDGGFAGRGQTLSRSFPRRALHAVLESMAGEVPTHGAVTQRDHRVFDAGIYQRLGADNAPGAPGAIDDHQSIGGRRDIVNAIRKLRSWHANTGGNITRVVLDHRTTVENDHVLALVHHLF